MRTLIVAPHLDDEAISCGGLIQVRQAQGWKVHVLFIHGRVYDYGRETEQQSAPDEWEDMEAARKILGYVNCSTCNLKEGEPAQVGYYRMLEPIEKSLKILSPDEVVIPSGLDLNQDHRFLNHVLGIALRPINLGRVSRVLEAIALDGTVQSPSYFVPLTDDQLAIKVKAIEAYRREARGGTSPRAPHNVVAQAQVWGSCCGAFFAEAYRLKFARELCASLSPGGQGSSAPT